MPAHRHLERVAHNVSCFGAWHPSNRLPPALPQQTLTRVQFVTHLVYQATELAKFNSSALPTLKQGAMPIWWCGCTFDPARTRCGGCLTPVEAHWQIGVTERPVISCMPSNASCCRASRQNLGEAVPEAPRICPNAILCAAGRKEQ